MSAEQIAAFTPVAGIFLQKMGALPQGVQDAYKADQAADAAKSEEDKAAHMVVVMAFFDQADANKDGRLDQAELFTMTGLINGMMAGKYGEWMVWSEADVAITYTAYNTVSADEGIAKADMMAIRPILRASIAALMAA